jgi:hypothetical protein
MKKILVSILVLLCMVSFGKCGKKKKPKSTIPSQKIVVLNSNQVWMRYDETICANPWQFNWLVAPTDEQLAGAVKSELEGKSIRILEIRTQRDNIVSCQACTCPSGFHYFVLVNKSVTYKLKELKFYEVKEVPELRVK